MPTYEPTASFLDDFDKLTPEQQAAFLSAVANFVHDLKIGQFRKGLRVKGVQGYRGIYEMTWAGDGRATFHYGEPVRDGERHIVWRRIGTHDIFNRP